MWASGSARWQNAITAGGAAVPQALPQAVPQAVPHKRCFDTLAACTTFTMPPGCDESVQDGPVGNFEASGYRLSHETLRQLLQPTANG